MGLSSTPSRVNEISPTLLDLLRQDVKADEIVLSLPKISARFGVPYTITDPTVRLLIDSGLVTLNELDDDYGPATKFVSLTRPGGTRGRSTDNIERTNPHI